MVKCAGRIDEKFLFDWKNFSAKIWQEIWLNCAGTPNFYTTEGVLMALVWRVRILSFVPHLVGFSTSQDHVKSF